MNWGMNPNPNPSFTFPNRCIFTMTALGAKIVTVFLGGSSGMKLTGATALSELAKKLPTHFVRIVQLNSELVNY